MQADLFERPAIAGLRHAEEFVTPAQEEELVRTLAKLDLAPFRFRGWVGNRKTRSFGWLYDFDDASFTPAEPIPFWLKRLQSSAAVLADLPPEELAHVLIARYDPGAGIGWHRDRPQFDKVIGISLGSAATLRLRQRVDGGFRRASLLLQPRSAYLLASEARWDWEHSIAPGTSLRFSITFRSLSPTGRRSAGRLI